MKLFLIVNREKDPLLSVSSELCKALICAGAEVLTTRDVSFPLCTAVTPEEGFLRCDTVLTVGGDGTILSVALDAARYGKPILGVNLGRVGFLARVGYDNVNEWIGLLLDGKWRTEERMMLSCGAYRGDTPIWADTGLNDAVLSHGVMSRTLSLSLTCDGQDVSEYRSDGLIFATPTGSTAYSLSSGGPVVDPSLEAILVTPICAHSLASRPVVFGSSSVLTARIELARCGVYLSVDGRDGAELKTGDTLIVRRADLRTKLIRFDDTSFYRVLSDKLKI